MLVLPQALAVVSSSPPPLLSAVLSSPAAKAGCYIIASNVAYLARRANIRKQSMTTMLKFRIEREPGVSRGMYVIFLLAWQFFVLAIFPLFEPLARLLFGYCCLFYSYPNAQGFGFILEPIELQALPLSRRAKRQIRLDWHKFTINVGQLGRDGYRHPPIQEMHQWHIDAPAWGIKHWPWRRRRQGGGKQ